MTIPSDPPDFAITCALMLGGYAALVKGKKAWIALDIDLADRWIASQNFPDATVNVLDDERAEIVAAYLRDDWDAVYKALRAWHKSLLGLRAAPLAKLGEKFTSGRKPGALGPIAKSIKAYLKKHPEAKALDVWVALAKKPPKEHEFRDTARDGKYVELGAKTVMGYARFRNLVSEHKAKK